MAELTCAESRNAHGDNLIPIFIPLHCSCVGYVHFIHEYSDFFSLILADCYIACGEGEYYKGGYKDVTSCGCVSASKTHSLFV